MLSSSPSETQQLTSQSTTQSAPTVSPDSLASFRHSLVSISAAVLCFSFFMPWISILGVNISGLDIQKETDASLNKLVWLLPLLPAITLILNITRQNTNVLRRLAGLAPFAFLVYGLMDVGSDLFKILAIGGWLSLIAGASLILIPNAPKPTKSS